MVAIPVQNVAAVCDSTGVGITHFFCGTNNSYAFEPFQRFEAFKNYSIATDIFVEPWTDKIINIPPSHPGNSLSGGDLMPHLRYLINEDNLATHLDQLIHGPG